MKPISRREFLSAGAAALALPIWAMPPLRRFAGPYGVQMYSIRAGMQTDPEAALAMVRGIGYTEIEAWQPRGVDARQLRPLLAAAGLRATGMHTDFAALSHGLPGLIANARELGAGWVVCAAVDPRLRQTGDDYRRLADRCTAIGGQLLRSGLRLGYHNHTEEFERFGGVTGYDILLAETDPGRVWFELDIGHARRAGVLPVALLRREAKRIRLLHLKDVAPKPGIARPNGPDDYRDVPMGTGVIDLPAVLAQAAANGVERYYVEEETGNVRRRLTNDYRYLRRATF